MILKPIFSSPSLFSFGTLRYRKVTLGVLDFILFFKGIPLLKPSIDDSIISTPSSSIIVLPLQWPYRIPISNKCFVRFTREMSGPLMLAVVLSAFKSTPTIRLSPSYGSNRFHALVANTFAFEPLNIFQQIRAIMSGMR
jgi:hypothetical protein